MVNERRVVVTGMGVTSCLGTGAQANWESLMAGRSGIAPITKFDASDFKCRVGGEVRDLDLNRFLSPKEAKRLDPCCHFVIAAADEALAQSGLLESPSLDPTRLGAVIGSGVGGINTFREQTEILLARGPSRISPLTVPKMISDMPAGILSIRHNLQGPNLAVVTACATGSHAIGEAMWIIRRGDADAVVAGGTEACIEPLAVGAFASMKALTTRNDDPQGASRPFDAERDGFVPSEGAGVLVLESLESARARGADILAEVVGYGLSADAFHMTAPDPEGKGAARAIRAAVAQSGAALEDVDYVNAHGTSTPLNDRTETLAIRRVFGNHADALPVSSTKSMTGHALGAAGGIEAVYCIQALLAGVVPPTINYTTPDPDCDLDYVPNEARELPLRTVLNINLGFGGHNAVLCFRRWD